MPKVKTKKTREEKLAQARLHKRKKYAEIKEDPEKYAVEKEKERLRYLQRKEQKKVKTIGDLTPREQRQKRKNWRESRKRYLEKKKKEKTIAQLLIDDPPPGSDLDPEPAAVEDPLEGPSAPILTIGEPSHSNNNIKNPNVCTNCIKKTRQIRKLRYIYQKKILELKRDLQDSQKKKAAVQRSLYRLIKDQRKSQVDNPSTDEKVRAIVEHIEDNKKEEVKKKLIFGEIITKQIKSGYKSMPKNDKRKFSDLFVKEDFKKHKILNTITSFTVKHQKTKENNEQKIKQEVENFFEDDCNSRIAAGKKEFKKAAGLVKQKRYLTDTLTNLHAKFLKTHDCEVGYSTFCKYRPFWVVFPKESNRNTCSCIVHTNMDLLIKALYKNKIIKETNGSGLLENLCCDTRKEECLNRTCHLCRNKVIEYEEFRNDVPIKYFQWAAKSDKYTVDGVEKVSRKTSKTELQDLPLHLITNLEESLPRYFKHCLNIVQQYKNISALKKSLTPREVLIHMDFSENYITKFHEEVQARHFGGSSEQITLHTSVSYFLDPDTGTHKINSMCTLSDCNRHDAEAIWAHIIPIIERIKDFTHIDTIHFVTDSPSSQYRNRKIFYIISQLQKQFPDLNNVTWNYLESGHGKGAPDGIGAVIKRTADACVRFGQDVGTLEDFWNILKAKMKNIEIHIITKKDIDDRKIPQNVNIFKGTMSVHQVLWSSNSLRMTFRKLSCIFCQNGIDCIHGYHLGYMDVPEDTIEPEERLLSDFLETNTTPEIIDEITNSTEILNSTQAISATIQDSLNYENQEGQSQNVIKAKETSNKVKILSEVRSHWSNTPFYTHAPSSSRTSRFRNLYTLPLTKNEKVKKKSTIEMSREMDSTSKIEVRREMDSTENKENEDDDDDDEFNIF